MLRKDSLEKIKGIKPLFMEMYKGFPNGRLSEEIVNKIIVTENDRNVLLDHGFLVKEDVISDGRVKRHYNLGPNALPLISSWKMEKLTFWMFILAIAALISAFVPILLQCMKLCS